jgi:anti-sigma regulatory factor (Ser/Thr protein kinase)/Fe-S-cluster-containing hydrogenase component 2
VEYLSYTIRGNDFGGAGAASRTLKEHLKRVGVDADVVRRTMIAAYEAEMNVVIHARRGVLEARLGDGRIDVDVLDQGPGIADVSRALTEGFSTASAEARSLGFGAGMGLPNIARNSDRLEIDSAVGRGTRVSFSIALGAAPATTREHPRSLAVVAERCTECRRCLSACPTEALRVREGRPSVLGHLCVDCACCIAACAPAALTIDETGGEADGPFDVLAAPAGFFAGFGASAAPARVAGALQRAGAGRVLAVEGYERALRAAVVATAAEGGRPTPLLSPVCPAAVALVELRFPSLLPQVAPFASPWEALQQEQDGQAAAYVVSCPSQRSTLLARKASGLRSVLAPRRLAERVVNALNSPPTRAEDAVAALGGRGDGLADHGTAAHDSTGEETASVLAGGGLAGEEGASVLVASGPRALLRVLEQAEDGLLDDIAVVEPYLCEGGCLGSPLLPEDASVAAHRWRAAPLATTAGSARPPARRPAARPGVRLDPDMATAIAKLARLDELTRSLPGRDCGACGAPTCAALAEDAVLGRATRDLCPYVTKEEETS